MVGEQIKGESPSIWIIEGHSAPFEHKVGGNCSCVICEREKARRLLLLQ